MAVDGALSLDHALAADAAQVSRSAPRPARRPRRANLVIATSEGQRLKTDAAALSQAEAIAIEEDARDWVGAPRGIVFGAALCVPFWVAAVAWALW
jgi:hypothetical protein